MFAGFVADRQPDFDLSGPLHDDLVAVVSEQFRDPMQKTMTARGFAAPPMLRQIERLRREHRESEKVAEALALVLIGH